MRSISAWLAAAALVALVPLGPLHGQPNQPSRPANPFPYAEHEPKAQVFSVAKANEYLDNVARFWMQTNSCGACHANFAYMMARPAFEPASAPPVPLVAQTRKFLEARKPHPDFSFDAHAVAIAFALAWDDARGRRKLQPATREALRRIWSLQRREGMWPRMGCGKHVPSENDFRYTVVLAALAAATAPEGYAGAAEARDGLTRLSRYLIHTPPRTMHDRALLLWASLHVDGLLTTAERAEAVQRLLACHGDDGGWSFAGLVAPAASPINRGLSSDGYGTGLTIYVLRQAGVAANQLQISRGLEWLRINQRASGRWFTPTPIAGEPTETGVGTRDLYVQNLGTAFSLLALKTCESGQLKNPTVAAVVRLSDELDRPDVSARAKHLVDTLDICDVPLVFLQKRRGGPGIGSAVQAGHKDSIDDLVNDWSGARPPTWRELQTHQQDLLQVARILQAMAELAPHRVHIYVSKKDEPRTRDWLRIAGEFKTVTRAFRHAIEEADPTVTRKAAVNLQKTCAACHTLVGVR
jgi:squalene-hopene/tetraprenyl-beta-curcumene cyclase